MKIAPVPAGPTLPRATELKKITYGKCRKPKKPKSLVPAACPRYEVTCHKARDGCHFYNSLDTFVVMVPPDLCERMDRTPWSEELEVACTTLAHCYKSHKSKARYIRRCRRKLDALLVE